MADTVKAVVAYDSIGWRDSADDIRSTCYADLGEEVTLPKAEWDRLSEAGAVVKPGSDEAKAAQQKAVDRENAKLKVDTSSPNADVEVVEQAALERKDWTPLGESESVAPHADPNLPPPDNDAQRKVVQDAIKTAGAEAEAEQSGDFSSMTVAQLDSYAEEHGVEDYPSSGKKAEKAKALEAHAASSGEDDGESGAAPGSEGDDALEAENAAGKTGPGEHVTPENKPSNDEG